MFCSKCGAGNNVDAKFCKACGQALGVLVEMPVPQPHQHTAVSGGNPPKRIIVYALAPIGVFIAMVVMWGIVNIVADATQPSPAVTFFNSILVPLVFGLSFLAIPIGIIYAIYANSRNFDGTGVIKCGNCGYIGQAKNGRRLISQILAWVAFILFWPITVVYYLVTHKYLCPQCGSSFVGVRNRDGAFTAPNGGLGLLAIVLVSFFVVAIVGVLASVVLASLNSARSKGADAHVRVSLSNLKAQAELYYDGNANSYAGFCNSAEVKTSADSMPKARMQRYVCNDTVKSYVITAPLSDDSYYCVDNTGAGLEIQTTIGIKDACGAPETKEISGEKYNALLDNFSIHFPADPTVDTQTIPPADDSSVEYTYRTYTANDGASSYIVATYVYAEAIDVSDPQTFLKTMVSNLSEGGQLVGSSYNGDGMHPEIEFTIMSGEEMLRGKAVLFGQTPFLIMYDYFPSNYSEDAYQTFVGSLEFH